MALHKDSDSEIKVAKNPVYHEKTKLVRVDCQIIRKKIEEKDVIMAYRSIVRQIGYYLTKAISKKQLNDVLSKLDTVNIYI